MEYRHELKFLIAPAEAYLLKNHLSLLMEKDPNGDAEGRYWVRSLYFDTLSGAAFFDKLDGVERRRKYRIRFYNADTDFIRLESKLKIDDLSEKTSVRIDLSLAKALMNGEVYDLRHEQDSVLTSFVTAMKLSGLRPAVIVDYQRTAYWHQALDVRITFDEQIRSRIYDTDLFKPDPISVPVLEEDEIVLEVKYNDIIPTMIADLIRQVPLTRLAVSKYAYCYNKK